MSVENNHRRFLYQRLYDYVLDEIRAGRLSMGDRTPFVGPLVMRVGLSQVLHSAA
jgi:DNA-binding GntR family transcriptional regulator